MVEHGHDRVSPYSADSSSKIVGFIFETVTVREFGLTNVV